MLSDVSSAALDDHTPSGLRFTESIHTVGRAVSYGLGTTLTAHRCRFGWDVTGTPRHSLTAAVAVGDGRTLHRGGQGLQRRRADATHLRYTAQVRRRGVPTHFRRERSTAHVDRAIICMQV